MLRLLCCMVHKMNHSKQQSSKNIHKRGKGGRGGGGREKQEEKGKRKKKENKNIIHFSNSVSDRSSRPLPSCSFGVDAFPHFPAYLSFWAQLKYLFLQEAFPDFLLATQVRTLLSLMFPQHLFQCQSPSPHFNIFHLSYTLNFLNHFLFLYQL